jgi:hypothetical protein
MQPDDTITLVEIHIEFPDQDIVAATAAEMRDNDAGYRLALAEIQTRNLNLQVNPDDLEPPFGWIIEIKTVGAPPVKSFTMIEDIGSDEENNYGLASTVITGIDPATHRPRKQALFEFIEKKKVVTDPATAIRTIFAVRDAGDGTEPALFTPVVGTEDILSRFLNCVRSSCSDTCLGAFTGCTGAFPLYFKCMVVTCDSCAIKCGAWLGS